MNVFKQLLRKEFGNESYYKYVISYQKMLEQRRTNYKQLYNQEVFTDIYDKLKECDMNGLQDKAKRLLNAMYLSMNITKFIWLRFVCCLAAVTILISMQLPDIVTVGSVGLVSACFLYSMVEYFVNRFCFIDAHIIIVYKSVLDALLLSKGTGTKNG